MNLSEPDFAFKNNFEVDNISELHDLASYRKIAI